MVSFQKVYDIPLEPCRLTYSCLLRLDSRRPVKSSGIDEPRPRFCHTAVVWNEGRWIFVIMAVEAKVVGLFVFLNIFPFFQLYSFLEGMMVSTDWMTLCDSISLFMI
jgi:hypothetical protein